MVAAFLSEVQEEVEGEFDDIKKDGFWRALTQLSVYSRNDRRFELPVSEFVNSLGAKMAHHGLCQYFLYRT